MTDHQLAVIPQLAATPAPVSFSALDIARHMNSLMDLGATLLRSGLLPESIKKPETAVAIIIKGLELGEQPMYALSNIVIVNGKPSISAEMMLARIYRAHGKRAIRVKVSEDTRCTVEYRLDGWPDIQSYTFSIEDAQRAGLTGKQVWKQYPAAMLRARCVSAVARMAFPECIAGTYVPGELGEDVAVTPDGEVISVSVEAPHRRQEPAQQPERSPRESSPVAAERITSGQQDGKAKHFRAKLDDLIERIGWTERDIDAVAVYDHQRPINELSGDELENTYRDLESLRVEDPDALRTLRSSIHEARHAERDNYYARLHPLAKKGG